LRSASTMGGREKKEEKIAKGEGDRKKIEAREKG